MREQLLELMEFIKKNMEDENFSPRTTYLRLHNSLQEFIIEHSPYMSYVVLKSLLYALFEAESVESSSAAIDIIALAIMKLV